MNLVAVVDLKKCFFKAVLEVLVDRGKYFFEALDVVGLSLNMVYTPN
jgi:hypothetical protein